MNRRTFLQTASLAATAPFIPNAAAAPAQAVRLDSDGMLRVRGRREFILGLYQVPGRDGTLREAAEAGFNLVHRSATREAYDEIQALGMWGWSALGSLPATNSAEAESRMRQAVELLRDHPALLFWETEDEPTFVWKEPAVIRTPPERINETAAFIRRLDAGHPLYLNQSPTNLESTLRRYNPASDIVATDIYPIIPRGIREMYALWPEGRQRDLLNDTPSQVGPYADKMRRVAGPRRAVFMVLQAFAWETLREKDRDPAMVLYPTAAQTRFMAWQAIVHGVNGLVWWGLSYTPADAPFWSDLRTVARELAQVRPALAAAPVRLPIRLSYHDTGHSLDRGIEWMAKPWGRDTLLIAVNADRNPVDVTFEGLQRFKGCEPMFESRPVMRSNDGLRERFEPFGARAWKLTRSVSS